MIQLKPRSTQTIQGHSNCWTALAARLCVLHRRGQRLQPAAGKDLLEVRNQFLMNEAIRRQNFAAVEAKRRTVKAGHASAGFLDQKCARGSVPGIQIELPEAVVAPASDVG